MTRSQPDWIGYDLGGRYRIEALLGQGGMSAVYRAHDPNLRRTVAVKLIHSHLANDPDFIQRFEQEAGAVAALRQRHIVQVFDFNHDGDTYYMVMEYIPGESLQGRLRALHRAGHRMPQADTVDLIATIAEAVGFAHKQGLVHRDLKPANIMLNAAGEPILMDFGVVKIVGGQHHTATGIVVGTPMYLAPELIRGRKPDARSDLYSLGVMLFEMLAGRTPFEADTPMQLMVKHVNEPVPDLRVLQPDVGPRLAAVVERALAKDPDQRYQSAGELAAALRAAMRPAATAAARPQPIPVAVPTSRRLATATAAPPAPLAAAPAPGPGMRRTPFLLACGALVVLGLIASTALAAVAMRAALSQGRATATATAPADTPVPTQAPATTLAPTARPSATGIPTDTPAAPTATPAASATAPPAATRPPPTQAPPTQAATTLATPTATATIELAARITDISIVDDRYAVSFFTDGYVAMLPGQHIHFFFNNVPPEQAGMPASGPWMIHAAEPNPFTGYAVSDRPSGATQMCILVANPNHMIVLNSGNCMDLP